MHLVIVQALIGYCLMELQFVRFVKMKKIVILIFSFVLLLVLTSFSLAIDLEPGTIFQTTTCNYTVLSSVSVDVLNISQNDILFDGLSYCDWSNKDALLSNCSCPVYSSSGSSGSSSSSNKIISSLAVSIKGFCSSESTSFSVFSSSNNSNYVDGALITLTSFDDLIIDEKLFTSSLGSSNFIFGYPGEYSYSISKDGFYSISGSFIIHDCLEEDVFDSVFEDRDLAFNTVVSPSVDSSLNTDLDLSSLNSLSKLSRKESPFNLSKEQMFNFVFMFFIGLFIFMFMLIFIWGKN